MLPLYAVSMCAFCLHGAVKIVVRLAAILLKKGTVKQNDVVASHKHAWRFHEPLKNKNGYILVINSLRNHVNNGLLIRIRKSYLNRKMRIHLENKCL